MRIAIALFEDAEELDFAGPFEVLATWAQHWPGDGVEVLTVADTAAPIRCANGLRVLADVSWDELGAVDVLVYPGGIGTRPQLGRDIDVRASERYVDDGDVITAAGVSAGIDVALHLIARLHSPARAAEVRREIQYDPQPPV